MSRFSIENMQNGLTLIRDRASGLQGCYDSHTGDYRHGDLHAVRLSLTVDSYGFRAAMLGTELVGYFDVDESGFYVSRPAGNAPEGEWDYGTWIQVR